MGMGSGWQSMISMFDIHTIQDAGVPKLIIRCFRQEIPKRYPDIDLLLIHLGGTTIPGPSAPLLMVVRPLFWLSFDGMIIYNGDLCSSGRPWMVNREFSLFSSFPRRLRSRFISTTTMSSWCVPLAQERTKADPVCHSLPDPTLKSK